VHQGWCAGKSCFGKRTLAASRRVRLWLALRLHAWRTGRVFELAQLTPHYLGQIEVLHCPITRQWLAPGEASVDRVCDTAGYAAGNLVMLAWKANRAKGALGWEEALQRAHRAAVSEDGCIDGLDAAAWTRLGVLISFVTPLSHEQAARLPLRILPPNRLRMLNPVQGLQALVTRELGRPDGMPRLRALAKLLPTETLRTDFARFLSALLPRCLEVGRDADLLAVRQALEDAWGDDRVNRHWQRFALQLDETLIERLLARHAASAPSGTRILLHDSAIATEGWALERRGRVAVAEATRRDLGPLPAALPRDRARMPPSRSRTFDGHLPA
jgi:hypothetical protein